MRNRLEEYNLTEAEKHYITVFMLLYKYTTVENIVCQPIDELQKHKGWDNEMESIILKMKESKPTH